MQYKQRDPSPQLACAVHCLWTLEGDAKELECQAQPILPDGRPELIVHFGDPFERIYANGAVERQPAVIFAGQLIGPILLQPTGRLAVVGVRFHADGAASVLENPQHELVSLTIGVDSVFPRLARALSGIRDRTGSLSEGTCAVHDCLTRFVDSARIDRRIRHAVDHIRRRRGLVAVDEIARTVGLTRRHLERRFRRIVGVSPKRLARITRFQRALRMLERLDSTARGTETAALCGYADQAHFVRDFRELAGCSPSTHLIREAELSGFFAEGHAERP